jgi:hypothetical protein
MSLSLNVLSENEAEIVSVQDGEPRSYPIKGTGARGIIAMYEHLKVCPEGGEAYARTYLTGVAAGIAYEAVEAVRRRYGFEERKP